MANRNTLWANVFVDELARAGLKAVCIAPGSRSTPLTIAFARHGGIRIFTHLDERSAGFFALGLALASDEPVALLCTSGTAAANFFPAIVEAHMSRVPLIVITADRPPELRHSGANQTIDQVKMYGDQVLWSVDAGLPEANPPAIAIRNLRTLAARAYARANGIRKGVVHLNMPFRKPLEPVEVEGDVVEIPVGAEAREDLSLAAWDDDLDYSVRFAVIQEMTTDPREGLIQSMMNVTEAYGNGLIVCGPLGLRGTYVSSAICMLGRKLGYPVLVDALSNTRFAFLSKNFDYAKPIGSYDTFLNTDVQQFRNVDVVIRFGNVPTSQILNKYLASISPKYYIHISDDGIWSDESHRLTHLVHTSTYWLCSAIIKMLNQQRDSELFDAVYLVEQETWRVIVHEIQDGRYFDGIAVHDAVELMPPYSTLFVGNSLPVRLLDQFGKPQDKLIYVYANRGASGIDGNISTALGAGAARPDHPLVAIVGDITFYHDMNGLLAVQRNGVPVTIVLLNNNGGGIFHRLPIKNFEPEFTDLFVMPHGLEFEHAARMYGLDYVRADDRESFRQAFSESVNNRLSRIIEVRTDAQHDLQRRQEIMDAVQARIKELDL